MQMVIRNLLPVLSGYFAAKSRSGELLSRYLEWAESEAGLFSIVKELKGKHGFQDLSILSAVRSDGLDLIEAQQQYGLFNPTRNVEATIWSFNESERLQLESRVARTLGLIAEVIPSSLLPEKLVVVILPADCANGTLMLNGAGVSCYGRTPGYLFLRVWPTPGNLNRLAYALARSFIHGIRRQAQHSVAAVSLGEAYVMEGLAATFIEGMFPDASHPALAGFQPPTDWNEALAAIAGYYGKASYDDVLVNIYGTRIHAGSMRAPEAVPLTEEELEYAHAIITAQANRTEANVVAAYLYGDPLVAAQGHPSYGIPHLAGFEVGYGVVKQYLALSGIPVGIALSADWRDIAMTEWL
ncbi:DUF2268 domain-containing putative Zn-dependent protease [Paenibacillus cymbidii]|uniref:DUF2268 domain-containing putative Zn-dependent protease n=1 Tax=Paenibacillus cymbidii TaxID=1639034 RepID=UPI001081235E|nr:DUF2268 domain-containing putative Zn-dependent protease [Paenibacillus cymbidii]